MLLFPLSNVTRRNAGHGSRSSEVYRRRPCEHSTTAAAKNSTIALREIESLVIVCATASVALSIAVWLSSTPEVVLTSTTRLKSERVLANIGRRIALTVARTPRQPNLTQKVSSTQLSISQIDRRHTMTGLKLWARRFFAVVGSGRLRPFRSGDLCS